MRYNLRTLDESVKQETDIEVLNKACMYYINMKSYLEAIPEAKERNEAFYNKLVDICYTTEPSPVDEPLTTQRVQADASFVSQNISEYYGLMKTILEQKPTL